jgi:hypothetical protein
MCKNGFYIKDQSGELEMNVKERWAPVLPCRTLHCLLYGFYTSYWTSLVHLGTKNGFYITLGGEVLRRAVKPPHRCKVIAVGGSNTSPAAAASDT